MSNWYVPDYQALSDVRYNNGPTFNWHCGKTRVTFICRNMNFSNACTVRGSSLQHITDILIPMLIIFGSFRRLTQMWTFFGTIPVTQRLHNARFWSHTVRGLDLHFVTVFWCLFGTEICQRGSFFLLGQCYAWLVTFLLSALFAYHWLSVPTSIPSSLLLWSIKHTHSMNSVHKMLVEWGFIFAFHVPNQSLSITLMWYLS
jgi:hypothetical protein